MPGRVARHRLFGDLLSERLELLLQLAFERLHLLDGRQRLVSRIGIDDGRADAIETGVRRPFREAGTIGIAGSGKVDPVARHHVGDALIVSRRRSQRRIAAVGVERNLAQIVEHVFHFRGVHRQIRCIAVRRRRGLSEPVDVGVLPGFALIFGDTAGNPKNAIGAIGGTWSRILRCSGTTGATTTSRMR